MAEKDKVKDSNNEIKTRLNNNEFYELIPYLKLDELFFIQIKSGNSWSNLFEISIKDKSSDVIKCTLCNEMLNYKIFKNHLKKEEHKNALKKVVQFYHPIYTYAKKSEKLANGQEVSEEELKDAIKIAVESSNKACKSLFSQAKRLAKQIEDYHIDQKKVNSENEMIEFALKMDMTDDSRLFLEIALPLEELIKVEYTTDNKEWKKMLTTSERPSISGKYFCHICLKNCAGIITVNAHLNGNLHKTNQATVEAMRLASNEKVTKYFVFSYDTTEHKIFVRRKAKHALLKKMEDALEEKEKNKTNVVKAANEEKSNVDVKIKEEPLDDNDKNEVGLMLDEYIIAADEIKKEIKLSNSETLKKDNTIKLSKEIAEKAKLLSKQFNKVFSVTEKTNEVDSEGILGLEYVIKILKTPDDKNAMYECCLCDFSVNESRMQSHLMGYNHRLKYCEMHYPDTMTLYKDRIGHMKYHEFYRIMGTVLCRLSAAIEKHHGLGSPFEVSYSYFSKYREEVTLTVYGLPHASQHKGPSFSNVITAEDILKIKRNKDTYVPAVFPSDHPSKFAKVQTKSYEKYRLKIKEKKEKGREREIERDREREKEKEKSRVMRSKSPRRERLLSRSRSRSEKHASSPRRRIKRNSSDYEMPRRPKDLWKLYREQISTAAIAVERAYMDYRRNPESHPNYDEEWNRYWRRRKEELQAQGIDHRSYNFQPEWVLYFRERLEQLFGEDLQNSKINVRKTLNIPLDAEEDSEDFITTPHVKSLSKEPPYKKNRYSEEIEIEPTISTLPDSKPNIIHALRLMTALEDHLGSLGSKIMQLLSNALTLEKSCSNNLMMLEQKILTPNNCSLLETAMEKLKGILYAGLLENTKIQAFNKVIENTTHLLKHAEDMGWRYETEKQVIPQTNATPTNSQTSQMNPKELQQLIDVMQNKRSDVFSLKQKSLSETLMDLISLQRNPNEPAASQSSNLKESNYSGGQNFNGDQRNRTGYSNSANSQNSNNKMRQQNNLYPNNSMRNDINKGNINPNNLSKFDNTLNRNASFDFPNRSISVNVTNPSGSGIGAFNNINYPNQSNSASSMGNISHMSHMRSGEGVMRNDHFNNRDGSQVNTNTGQNFNNMNRPTGFYQNAFGNGSGDNWGRFQNNQQPPWQQDSQNQQGPQQFRNK